MNDHAFSMDTMSNLASNFGLFFIIFSLFLIACLWLIYSKADLPGWAAFVPIYNVVIMLRLVGKPLWWLLLFIIPGVNVIAIFICLIALSKSFGKNPFFALGLFILPIIFWPVLAFGQSEYQGPGGTIPVDPNLAY